MKMQAKHYSRKFLNNRKGIAAVETEAYFTEYEFNAWVKLSDCNRNINLEFYSYNEKEIKERSDKLNILIGELTKLREWFDTNTPKYLALKKAREEKYDKDNSSNGIVPLD